MIEQGEGRVMGRLRRETEEVWGKRGKRGRRIEDKASKRYGRMEEWGAKDRG